MPQLPYLNTCPNTAVSVFKYHLKIQILTLEFKYILVVFKCLAILYNSNPLHKFALSLITVQLLALRDFGELSEDQRNMYKIF